MAKAREAWARTKNPYCALAELGGRQCIERQLLEGLKKCDRNDLVTALSLVRLWRHNYFIDCSFCYRQHLHSSLCRTD